MATKGKVPTLTLGDRMMLAREHANITSSEMAEHFGVSRHTITNYEKGRTDPNRATLIEWSRLTGYDLAWIMDGQLEAPAASDEDLARTFVALLRGRDSNSQPTGLSPERFPQDGPHPQGWDSMTSVTEAEYLLASDRDRYELDVRVEPARIIPMSSLSKVAS